MSELATAKVKHLSVTKIEAAMKCPLQFKFRYVDRIPEPSLGSFLGGRVVHKVIERALNRVMLNQGLPDAKEMDDWYLEEWEAHVREEESKEDFIGWVFSKDDSMERSFAECRALIPFTRTEVLPGLRPKLVEHGFKMEFPSPVGSFLVWGYIDLFEEDEVLSDWKTTLGKPSKNQLKMGMQFPGYSWKIKEFTRKDATACRKIFLLRGQKPNLKVQKYTVTQAHRDWFAFVASEVWKMCQAEAYVANPNGWWCSPGWCSHWGSCPHGSLQEEVL